MTAVIITGGIDLSVGSLMGLAAILFGKMWRDGGLPIPLAAGGTLAVGLAAGSLNALLITRLRLPPLIVTLGSFSLFRGLAEGLTGGVDNFAGFPHVFVFFGRGDLLGRLPAQLPALVVAAVAIWILLHRTTIGRGLYAIGLSPQGARFAGIPVARRLTLVYLLSSTAASLAAIIHVARQTQAKADVGMGYELTAITAVVLGGTSIFGGRGTVHGTLLGVFAIVVLQVGLQLADLPGELAGILTGVLLVATLAIERLSVLAADSTRKSQEEFKVKNIHVAVLSAVILLGAIIVAGSNWLLVASLRKESTGTDRPNPATRSDASAATKGEPSNFPSVSSPPTAPVTVAMMPKSKGNAYFVACRKGAEEAAKQLGVKLIWDGPTDPDPAKQNEVVENWITRGVDVIAPAVENREGIASVLRKARESGIKVLTWDADTLPDARDFLVNQATPEGIGHTLMDHAARVLGNKGEFAIITASLTAANMIEWQKHIEARRKEKYPDIKMAALRPCDDLQKKAFDEANTILNAYPNVRLIMAICSPAVPGAAEAVKQSGRKDVKVIGLGLPSDNKDYVHAGVTDCVVLWNTMDLGYLTVYAAHALKTGTLKAGDKSIEAGRLGRIDIEGDNILLGKPFTFTKENIDRFDF
jgi:rhamnose transport system permease protein